MGLIRRLAAVKRTPWLHVKASPRVARLLIAAGAQDGRRK